MPSRVLETVLTGRNLLSPVLAAAGRDVAAFNAQVAGANTRSASAATTGAAAQSRAATDVAQANSRAATSATTSAAAQSKAHASAAQSATVSAHAQESANRALAGSNAMLGTSLTPLTAGLGAVALGLGYAAYSGMTFDKSMSGVAAASQASGAELERLRQAALDAGADTQYSAEESAAAITELAKAGVSTADVLGGGLTGALNLAAAGEMEVAAAAEVGATALSVFRLEGDQMSHVADLLAAGAGKAQGSVADMGMALNQSALVADQAGLSIEDTTGALAMFASNGLLGSDAGTSFKTMLQALTPNSEKAAKVMQQMGMSAFDASGEFVGLEVYAGKLRTALAGMTEEQRNSTLETIFGSDAVRAAAILYKEGAPGVAEWASKVNDAGFAARQAAANNDNLAGDLEKLSGAVKTVFTEMGQGAQGPLRAVVQALTFLVDIGGDVLGFWNNLPGPVQAALVAMGAFVALRGPLDALWGRAAAGVTSLVTGMGMATGATTGLGVAAGGARIAVAGLAAAAAPLAGITILASAVQSVIEFTQAGDAARDSIDQVNQSLRDMGGTSDRVDAISSAIIEARTQMREYGEIIEAYDSQGWFDKNLWYVPFGGEKTEVEDARQSLEAYEEQLYALEEANNRAERATNMLARSYGLTGAEVVALADKYDINLTGAIHESRRLFENFYNMEFGSKPTEAAIALTAATEDTRAAVDEAKQAVDDYKLSLDILSGQHVSMLQVESAFQDALDASTGAMDDLGGSVLDVNGKLNMQSENGRTAANVLLDIRDSGNQLIATMIEQGATADEVREKDRQLRESFIRSAGQMGISRQAAELLASQILGIPAERETRIDADTRAAQDKIADVQSSIDGLRGRTVEVQVRAAGRFVVNPQGGLQEFAEGGWTGPGSKYQPAGIVHADEFVVPKQRVNALGGPTAVGALVGMPGYANGGPVLPLTVVHDTRSIEATMEQVANAMKTATPKGGTAGSDAISGSGWQPIWNYVKARVPAARINSTYRPGDPGRHGRGLAIDFGYGTGPGGAGSAGLALINRVLHDGIGSSLAELIYDGIGDDRPDLRMGRPHTYNAVTRRQHANHVHAAREYGGAFWPGQDFLVGENGPELARFGGVGAITPANRTATMLSPAAMPGYTAAGASGGVAASIDYRKLGEAVAAALPPMIGNVTFPTSDSKTATEAVGDLVHEIRVLGRGGKYSGGPR